MGLKRSGRLAMDDSRPIGPRRDFFSAGSVMRAVAR